MPFHRFAPALPCLMFLCWPLETSPIVAVQRERTFRCSPDGSRTITYPSAPAPSDNKRLAPDPLQMPVPDLHFLQLHSLHLLNSHALPKMK